jgi:hypothetical protein
VENPHAPPPLPPNPALDTWLDTNGSDGDPTGSDPGPFDVCLLWPGREPSPKPYVVCPYEPGGVVGTLPYVVVAV